MLAEWAARWGVPPAALADLAAMLGAAATPQGVPGESEAAVQARVRLEASKAGARLFRNNVGAVELPDGGFLRYGLANDSKQMNARLKSSDLVGIRPVVVTPDMIGRTLGQFLAREVKRGGWRYTGTPRERAQLAFITLIQQLGGDAAFAADTGTI